MLIKLRTSNKAFLKLKELFGFTLFNKDSKDKKNKVILIKHKSFKDM